MRIYSTIRNGTVLVQPRLPAPDGVEFLNAATQYAPRGFEDIGGEADGPIVVRVEFENGVADVPKPLGRYMVRQGLAGRWPWSA